MDLLIYCTQQTPRVKYIFDFIFKDILGCTHHFTDDQKYFNSYTNPKISYTNKALGKELSFKAEGLLFRNEIEALEIDFTEFGGDKVPFAVVNSIFPFDIFAASFYFLSRYEEYLPFIPDQHLRFPAEVSLQYKLALLRRPIIDEWALLLKNLLLHHFPDLTFHKRKFQFQPTVDIDRAYHFKSNGIVKNTARFIQAILKNDREKLSNLINTGLNKRKDPFDTYRFLHQTHEKYGHRAIFFFLLSLKGDKNHDVNIHPNDELLQNTIKETQKYADVGIHPSYASNNNHKRLQEETALLEDLLQEKINLSRQHFLKLHLPKTYLQLIKVGIEHDYSMGYASQPGFRAGTCTAFYWYDLQLEKQSHLKVHSFAAMDQTFRKYLKVKPAEAIEILESLIKAVKMVDGTFCSLWHNESLSETAEWRGWKEVYERMMEMGV